MKTALATLLLSFALIPAAPEPVAAGRCVSLKPICPPGQHAICICESDVSLNCAWICAGR